MTQTLLRCLLVIVGTLVTTILPAETTHTETTNENGSVYEALVEIQTVDSLVLIPEGDGEARGLAGGSEGTGGHRPHSPGHPGRPTRGDRAGAVAGAGPYDGLATFETAHPQRAATKPQVSILVESDEFTKTKPKGFRSRAYPFEIPEVEADELPFVDQAGDANRNYALLIGAEWCLPCKKLQKTVIQLREEGYRIYILDVDAFPDIKDKLNRLAPQAPQIGAGVPWLVIREGGKTVKLFKGVTDIETIRPFLIPYQDQLDQEGETDYNFVDEADRP